MAYRFIGLLTGSVRSKIQFKSTPTAILNSLRASSSSAFDATNLQETTFPIEPDIISEEPALDDATWTDPNTSLITSTEITTRQRALLQLTTSWLRAQNRSTTPTASPLILITSNPPQFQAHTSIPVDNCKQNTNFTYFSGLHSGESDQLTSDCVLALYSEAPEASDPLTEHRAILFAPTRTKSEQLWNGPDLANSSYRVQGFLGEVTTEIRPLGELVDFVNGLVKRSARRDVFLTKNALTYRPELVTHLKYYLVGAPKPGTTGPGSTPQQTSYVEKWSTALAGAVSAVTVRDVTAFVDQLRVFKSPAEALALRRIGRIGAGALKRTMAWTRDHGMARSEGTSTPPPFYESYVAAKFEFESRLSGAKRIAFPSVCASGRRSTIIHYGRNDRAVKVEGDWMLTDVGAEDPDGYCCDISRTWPVSFTSNCTESFQLRLQLYEALVAVQHRLVASIIIGETSLDDLYRKMQVELTKLLIEFDVFEEDSILCADGSANVASLTRRICPHHVSHYIGLDIHDTPTYSLSKPLQPGMCFSIEPGLYFPTNATLPIKPEFRGIGLRIEDDFLVDPTTSRLINLTADCPSL